MIWTEQGLIMHAAGQNEQRIFCEILGRHLSKIEVQTFLKEKGSPHSRIEKCNITNEKEVAKLQFNDFEER